MKKKGFTLIELVITIFVIVILSTISVPIYENYVTKAQLSEGYVLLAAIRDAQFRYYNEWGNFLLSRDSSSDLTANEEVLGIDARTNKYFTCFCVHDLNECSGNCFLGFVAYTVCPNALRQNGAYLKIRYNVTSGTKFRHGNYEPGWLFKN